MNRRYKTIFLLVRDKFFTRNFNWLKSLIGSLGFSFVVSWKSSKKLMFSRTVLEIVSAFIPIIQIYMSKEVINLLVTIIQNNNKRSQYLSYFTLLVIAIFILQVINSVMQKVSEVCASTHKDLIENYVNMQIMNKSISLDLSYFDSPKFYNELINAKNDSMALQTLTWSTVNIIRSSIQIAASVSILFGLFWLLPVMLVVFNIPSVLIQKKYITILYNWNRSRTKEQRKMGYINGILSGRNYAKDIRLFNICSRLIDRYSSIWKAWFSEKLKISVRSGVWATLVSTIPQAVVIFITYYVGMKIINGKLTVGDYSLYTGIVGQLVSGLSSLISSIVQIYDNNMRISHYSEFLSWKSNLTLSGTKKPGVKPCIEFRNVSFKYPGTERYILKNLSFSIGRGEKVAFVGLNGAGKSTIIKIILRFYEPTEGDIYIDSINIKEYDVNELRRTFSVMFQDYAIYSFTARECISMSDMDNAADEMRMKHACKMSEVDKLCTKWAKGLDSYLTKVFEDEGEELSGGEWQKVAIARTFFHNGSIMIFDEPAASLDPEAEHKIFEYFQELCNDKGAIFISHRLSSVTKCDKIFVLEDGKVTESGTHIELLKYGGKYAYLFNLQAEKYKFVV
jgi:ABC-type multidrug transport system, ATPase and permease components